MARNRSSKGERGSFPGAKRRAKPKVSTGGSTPHFGQPPKGTKRYIPERTSTRP